MNLNEAKAWVEKKVGRVAMTRGYEYFRENRIEIMDDSNEYDVIRGTCKGTTVTPYVLWASISKSNDVTDSYCSCPVGNNGDCKHIAALLFAWKLKREPKLNQQTPPKSNSNSKERHLYPGPFSSTLPECNKEFKSKLSKPSNNNKISKKKMARSPYKNHHFEEQKPKLEIIGIKETDLSSNHTDIDETNRLKVENENLRSQIENLTLQINDLKEKVNFLFNIDNIDCESDLNQDKKEMDAIKFKRPADDNYDRTTEIYVSPTKKSKTTKRYDNDGSPVDRAINILFNKEEEYLKGDILSESHSQELLLSM